ncbi:MAG: hypothetical protein VCA74_05205, partial [Deltaproteobacteria bacterium]
SGGVHEIVVGAMQGSAEVRIFDFDTGVGGANLRISFDAYSQNVAGVNLAVGDLDGDGRWEIVTAPVVGKPLIRAWNSDGTPFQVCDGDPETCSALEIWAFDQSYEGGVKVAVADVDADGRNEIIVAPASSGIEATIKAFEMDGSEVSGWNTFMPFGPGNQGGTVLVTTNRFFRRGAGAAVPISTSATK